MENNIQINLESISKNAKEIFHRLRWKGHIYCPQCGSIRIATDKQSNPRSYAAHTRKVHTTEAGTFPFNNNNYFLMSCSTSMTE